MYVFKLYLELKTTVYNIFWYNLYTYINIYLYKKRQ